VSSAVITGSAGAGQIDACGLVTAAEFAAIAGGTLDDSPGGGETCTADFDGYSKQAQVQVVEGFGMGSGFEDLMQFWKEENAAARGRGETVEERVIGDAMCWASVPAFLRPSTRCIRAKGRLVVYATLSQNGTEPPSMEAAMKLLDTAFARLR
jgi:hypothetical protein